MMAVAAKEKQEVVVERLPGRKLKLPSIPLQF
jgi:hypothetical protein